MRRKKGEFQVKVTNEGIWKYLRSLLAINRNENHLQYYCVSVHMWYMFWVWMHTSYDTWMRVKRWLLGVCSFFPCGSWVQIKMIRLANQELLSAEPSHWPRYENLKDTGKNNFSLYYISNQQLKWTWNSYHRFRVKHYWNRKPLQIMPVLRFEALIFPIQRTQS